MNALSVIVNIIVACCLVVLCISILWLFLFVIGTSGPECPGMDRTYLGWCK